MRCELMWATTGESAHEPLSFEAVPREGEIIRVLLDGPLRVMSVEHRLTDSGAMKVVLMVLKDGW